MSKRFALFCLLAFVLTILTGCIKTNVEESPALTPTQTKTEPTSAAPSATMAPSATAAPSATMTPSATAEPTQTQKEKEQLEIKEILPGKKLSVGPDGENKIITLDSLDDGVLLQIKDADGGNKTSIKEDGHYMSAYYFAFPDGGACVSVSLSGESEDWWTVVHGLDGGETCKISGYIEGIENTSVTVTDFVNVMGTYRSSREYGMTDDYVLEPSGDGLWHTRDNDQWIQSSKALSVKMLQNGNYKASTLEPGTEMQITATDNETYALFVLRDGKEGKISFTMENYQLYIDGEEDWNCFDMLPYAG